MSAEAWSALAGNASAIIAIAALIVESRRSRFSRAIDILSRMDQRFDSTEFRETRRRAARQLLAETPGEQGDDEAVRAVLNFFETLAYLYRHKAISADMIWHYYGSWLLPYYIATRRIVELYQRVDPNCYRETGTLYEAVYRVEEKQRSFLEAGQAISEVGVQEALRLEARLPTKQQASRVD